MLVGRCHEGDYAPALWPWVTIVRGLPGAADVPELAPLLASGATPDLSGGSGMRMFDAVIELLANTARRQPLLLVLEDIHWADATTLQLLRHLAATRACRAARRRDHASYRRRPPARRPR